MPKRNFYYSRGDFLWVEQEENETPEAHWRKLVSPEKNCEFKNIKQEDLLISKFITSITDKKLRENLIREKTLNLKSIMNLVTQDSYERRHKQSTIPPALAKEKEINEEPNKKYNRGTNKTTGKMPTQQRRTITVDFADSKTGHHHINARLERKNVTTATKRDSSRECVAAKPIAQKKQKNYYLEETYNEEEEKEPEELQQVTQINRVLPDKNDNYGIKQKINGKYQNFTFDTGSPVKIMPINLNSTTKKILNR